MKNKKVTLKSISIGFFDLLALLFIALKLVGVICWSWWWVLLPVWGPFVLAIVAVCVFLVWYAISDRIEWARRKRKKKK